MHYNFALQEKSLCGNAVSHVTVGACLDSSCTSTNGTVSMLPDGERRVMATFTDLMENRKYTATLNIPFTATRIYLCAMKSTRIRDAHIYMRVFVTSKQLPLAPANLLCCCQNSLATLKHSCYSILTCLLWFLTLVSLCKQTPTKQ